MISRPRCLVVVMVMLAASCASGAGAPAAVSVSHRATELTLEPISWCNDGGCSDGSAADTTATLGEVAGDIELHYEAGWMFWADLVVEGRTQGPSLVVVDRGGGEWTITVPPQPGRHRVDVVGVGDGSDLAVSFWVEIPASAE